MNTLADALYQFGHLKEVSGSNSNPELLEIIRKYVPGTKDDSLISWCSIILMYALSKEGYDIKNATVAARSWLKVGKEIKTPEARNAIVVFWRDRISSWKGHVGIYMGKSSKPGYIKVLGGNQNDKVNVAEYPISRVLGYRELTRLETKEIKISQIKELVKDLNDKFESTFEANKKEKNQAVSNFLKKAVE